MRKLRHREAKRPERPRSRSWPRRGQTPRPALRTAARTALVRGQRRPPRLPGSPRQRCWGAAAGTLATPQRPRAGRGLPPPRLPCSGPRAAAAASRAPKARSSERTGAGQRARPPPRPRIPPQGRWAASAGPPCTARSRGCGRRRGEGARGRGCGRRGPAGGAGRGRGRHQRPALPPGGARRGAGVTLISPDPSPRRSPRCGTSVPGTVCDVKGTASRARRRLPGGEEAAWGRPGL